MYDSLDSISPKWVGEIVYEKRNTMTQEELVNLSNLVVTISTVSCMETFKIYNELMECEFFVDGSLNPSNFKLNEFLYVGPDAALFSIACKLGVKNN